MRVGMIGVGRMGWPMAVRLIAAGGQSVTVLARRDEVAERARDVGMSVGRTIADVCHAAELVVVCVFSDTQVLETCLGASGVVASAPEGCLIVIHTTGSPATAQAVSAAGAAKHLRVLDVPVSGGSDDILGDGITLFAGGSDEDFDAARDVLDIYGSPVIHAGPLGMGQRIKLVNNALFAANIGLTAEALRVADELGIAEGAMLTALCNASGGRPVPSMVRAAGGVAPLMAGIGEFLAKDVTVVDALASELGLELGALAPAITAAGLTGER